MTEGTDYFSRSFVKIKLPPGLLGEPVGVFGLGGAAF